MLLLFARVFVVIDNGTMTMRRTTSTTTMTTAHDGGQRSYRKSNGMARCERNGRWRRGEGRSDDEKHDRYTQTEGERERESRNAGESLRWQHVKRILMVQSEVCFLYVQQASGEYWRFLFIQNNPYCCRMLLCRRGGAQPENGIRNNEKALGHRFLCVRTRLSFTTINECLALCSLSVFIFRIEIAIAKSSLYIYETPSGGDGIFLICCLFNLFHLTERDSAPLICPLILFGDWQFDNTFLIYTFLLKFNKLKLNTLDLTGSLIRQNTLNAGLIL